MNNDIKNSPRNRRKMHIAAILCLLVLYTSAQAWVQQQKPQHPITPQTAASAANKKVIQLIQAETLNKRIGFDPQILIDNVVMYHDGAFMYCDSAYLDEATNQFEAFGTVRVEQGDTLFLYGSYLQYDGNTQLLRVRNNVRLVNRDVTLFTDSLDYDRLNNIGYYFDGGMLVDSLNELTSYWGQYEPSKQLALFRDSVKLTNPKFVMFTDTLLYNTNNKVATILGPTRIESDSATIYSTRGWYDTTNELSLLLDQSRIINKEGNRILIGDSISYHKKDGYGEVFGNMFLQDTIKKIILTGNYGYYNEITNYAMATDSARAIEYSQPDSLFLHADTLKLITDSIYREIKGYYNVRFYRTDLQGVCDSLLFKTKDSILYMYKNPVLWNENNQILGDSISIFFNDSTIDRAHIRPNAFSIEQKDSLHFNQLKGRSLKAFFEGKQIRHILVEGNAESIFYPEEEDKSMMGMNQTESSYLSIDFKDKKIEKLKLWPKATGKMIPLSDLKPDMGRLPDFEWLDYLRPLDRDDVFRKVKRKGGFDPSKPRSNVSAEPQ
ncbi:OstA-like protein [Dysgonomonas alginatilytica]|nr:OstA-like protein [Dysgonomonas alginatilytica]